MGASAVDDADQTVGFLGGVAGVVVVGARMAECGRGDVMVGGRMDRWTWTWTLSAMQCLTSAHTVLDSPCHSIHQHALNVHYTPTYRTTSLQLHSTSSIAAYPTAFPHLPPPIPSASNSFMFVGAWHG